MISVSSLEKHGRSKLLHEPRRNQISNLNDLCINPSSYLEAPRPNQPDSATPMIEGTHRDAQTIDAIPRVQEIKWRVA